MSHFKSDSNTWYCVLGGVAVGAAGSILLAHITGTPSWCSSSSPSSSPSGKIDLKYWNGRGLMEVPRTLLALAGMFPSSDYVDGRYTTDDPPTPPAQSISLIEDKLAANLGRMPVLTVGNDSVGQSAAINYYLAASLGFMGSNHFEAARIISIQEHLKEMKDAYRKIIPYGSEPTEDNLKTWFEDGAKDQSPARADMQNRTRYASWFAGRIEYIVGGDGYAVGSKISLADVLIYNTFAETLEPSQAKEGMASHRMVPFCSKEKTEALLEKHPKLKKICSTVASRPGVKKWISMRGVQAF